MTADSCVAHVVLSDHHTAQNDAILVRYSTCVMLSTQKTCARLQCGLRANNLGSSSFWRQFAKCFLHHLLSSGGLSFKIIRPANMACGVLLLVRGRHRGQMLATYGRYYCCFALLWTANSWVNTGDSNDSIQGSIPFRLKKKSPNAAFVPAGSL